MAASASKVAAEVSKRDGDAGRWSAALLPAYSVTFAFGLVVLAVVLLLNVARASRVGMEAAQARAELGGIAIRTVLYPALVMVLPMVVIQLLVVMRQAGAAALEGSVVSFGDFMNRLGEVFAQNPLEAVTSGPLTGFLLLVMAGLLVVCMLLWLVQDMVAQAAVLLLVLLIPIVLALSLQPRAHQRLIRLMGAVAGVILTPFVTRFAFWAFGPVMLDTLGSQRTLTLGLLQVVVFFAVVTSAPLVLSYVMPQLVSGAGSVAAGAGVGALIGQAGQHTMDAATRLMRSTSGGASRAAGSAPAAAASGVGGVQGAAGSGSAAAAGGAARVAGPAGIALAVAGAGVAAGQAVSNTARGQAAQVLAASGAGHGGQPGSPMHVPQLRETSGRRPDPQRPQPNQATARAEALPQGTAGGGPGTAGRPGAAGRPGTGSAPAPQPAATPQPPVLPPAVPEVRQNPPVAGGQRP